MDDKSQQLPARSAGWDQQIRQCCCNRSLYDAVDAGLSTRRCGCSRMKPAISQCRQVSVTSGDSGVGLSLDPITEADDISAVNMEDGCIQSSAAVICQSHERECYDAQDDAPSEQSGLLFKTVCEHHQPSTAERRVSGNRRPVPFAFSRSVSFGSGRVRTRSESCIGDNVVIPTRPLNRREDACINFCPQNQFGAAFHGMAESQQKYLYKPKDTSKAIQKPHRKLWCFMLILALISFASVGIAAVAYSNFRTQFYLTKNKIQELQESIEKLQASQMPVPAGIHAENTASITPHIHLQLDGSHQTRETSWNGKILSWIPDVVQSEILQYDQTKSTITVQEAGSYFVYNQVYIARMLRGQEPMEKNIVNQTVMHTIYKIPFNYPATKRPVSVAESVVSRCWNEDATTQIQASYQGLVVSIERNEQLLVGLDSYHGTVDRLIPTNTFFGMFKL